LSILDQQISRREALKMALMAGAGVIVSRLPLQAWQQKELPLITKAIPSSGEKIPVVGLGTNQYGAQTPEEFAPRREVLKRFAELGGKVVDTAPAYGRSEEVIGQLLAELGTRKQLFVATKVTMEGDNLEAAKQMLENSFKVLKTDRLDLVQVHNLRGAEGLLPLLAEWKKSGRIRYFGITTSNDEQYGPMEAIMRKHGMDFIQVDYSVMNRNAEERILPLAQERGMAVLANMPFGGRRSGNFLGSLKDKPLPSWAAEIDCSSWAQLCLKYVFSHSAITCAIPGTIRTQHVEDNLKAARGAMPGKDMRQRIEQAVAGAT
jgi:aryl-alcohol dehydrogenase-like predicted oxidoreductase